MYLRDDPKSSDNYVKLLSQAPPPLLSLRYFQVSCSLFSSPAYTLLLPQLHLPLAKQQEDQRGKMVNSLPIQWHFKFWSSLPIHLPLFAFQSPQKAAPCTLSRFYSCIQQQQQEGRCSVCELELETQSVMFKIFFPLLCVCVHKLICSTWLKKKKKYQRHNSPANAPTTIVFNLKA